MEEVWADILGFDGFYQISSLGRVRTCVALCVKRDRWEKGWPWRILKTSNVRGYEYIRIARKEKGRSLKIHRILWEAFRGQIPVGLGIDHINGDPLDNRIDNLRLATQQEQNRNKSRKTNRKMKGKKGVYFISGRALKKPWLAKIIINKKAIHLGYFVTELEAAKAYNEAARKYFGEFAKLNVLDSEVC